MPFLNSVSCFRASILVSRVATRRYLSDSSKRIYVAADSPRAQFIAHSLRDAPKPAPVTVLFNTKQRLAKWRKSPGYIALHNQEYGDCIRQSVDVELARSPYKRHNKLISSEEYHGQGMWKPHYDARSAGQSLTGELLPPDQMNMEPIENYIVAEKPQYVVSQLLAVRHRLGAHSTVLIVSSMLGIMEEVMLKVFPDAEHRPRFILAEMTHVVNRPSETREYGHDISFQIMHYRIGTMYFARNPMFGEQEDTSSLKGEETQEDYLVNMLLRSPRLSALPMTPLELHMRQLDAVAIRSVVRPMTAMMDTSNGSLLFNYHLTRAMRLLIAETSLILRSLPELRGHPNAETRYGPDRLEKVISGILKLTWEEHNETLIDLKRGSRVDVDYTNGYIIARAQQLGLKAFMNFMMQELVKGKQKIIARENEEAVKNHRVEAEDQEIGMDAS